SIQNGVKGGVRGGGITKFIQENPQRALVYTLILFGGLNTLSRYMPRDRGRDYRDWDRDYMDRDRDRARDRDSRSSPADLRRREGSRRRRKSRKQRRTSSR
ncbi:MAG: hypothetical protein CMB64_03140, partial [Euryarchaeota archaeon]|nr:hypothetical protein [Euryarchaeota archaeon]